MAILIATFSIMSDASNFAFSRASYFRKDFQMLLAVHDGKIWPSLHVLSYIYSIV